MPPKQKVTKDEIVEAALNIIRDKGVSAITAQEIAKRMNTSTRPMFSYFATLEDLRMAAIAKARSIYERYALDGLSKVPSFKGFGVAYIRFAMDEPALFRVLFMEKRETTTFRDFLTKEGHWDLIIKTVKETFHLDQDKAECLYENLWIYSHGLASFCAIENITYSDAEIAERLGIMCRGLLVSFNIPKDTRTGIVPNATKPMPGSLQDYLLKS